MTENLRWRIAWLLALATGLSYLDRQTLPVVVSALSRDIPVSDAQFSQMQFWFLLAYGLMYAGGGRLADWLGVRAGYAIFITWWSLATFAHGLANSVAALGAARFLLGLGEGGGFPASAKAVSEWFPARDRSLAFGIFNTGSSVGAIIAPPLLAFLASRFSWRAAFYVTGAMGLAWAAAWLRMYARPDKHRSITPAEREYLERHLPPAPAAAGVPWFGLLARRPVIGLLAAKLFSDAAWYFFLFWLPKYLGDVRGLNIREIGYFAWIPYAFMGAGSFFGGWLSSRLIRGGMTLDRSRKLALLVSASMMPVSLFIASAPLSLAIVFFSLAMMGHQFWATILQTLPADMFPPAWVGSVAGWMGAVGSFGGMGFNLLVGWILTSGAGYGPVFAMAGLMHLLSFGLLLAVVRKIEPVPHK